MFLRGNLEKPELRRPASRPRPSVIVSAGIQNNSPTLISVADADLASGLARFARKTYAEAFGAELGEQVLQAHIENNMSNDCFAQMMQVDTFYVAHVAEELLGFVQVGSVQKSYKKYVNRFDVSGSEVRRLYVASAQQNLGIGSGLLSTALEDASVKTTSTVYLTTWEANHGAQRLYRRNGFMKVGEIPEYDSRGELNGYEHIMARSI